MQISKEIIYQNLLLLLEQIFRLPDISYVQIREHEIYSPTETAMIRLSLEDSYHDVLSDMDIKVFLKKQRPVAPAEIGWTRETYLGLTVSENHTDEGAFQLYRAVLKNGMRYDLSFATIPTVWKKAEKPVYTTAGWDLAQADSFWFIAVQALGKLYRRDFLIADHLTHMLINETLVVQMVDRDNQHDTNIHRYGYAEELEYQKKPSAACPYEGNNDRPTTFYHIADKLFAATAAYDRLVPILNPAYESRQSWFYEIWRTYENTLQNEQ